MGVEHRGHDVDDKDGDGAVAEGADAAGRRWAEIIAARPVAGEVDREEQAGFLLGGDLGDAVADTEAVGDHGGKRGDAAVGEVLWPHAGHAPAQGAGWGEAEFVCHEAVFLLHAGHIVVARVGLGRVEKSSLSEENAFEGHGRVAVLQQCAQWHRQGQTLEGVAVEPESEGACQNDIDCRVPVAFEMPHELQNAFGLAAEALDGQAVEPRGEMHPGQRREFPGARQFRQRSVDHLRIAAAEVGRARHHQLWYLAASARAHDARVVAVDNV